MLFPTSFQFQQSDFIVQASAIASEVAVGSHHAMARHDETNGIPSHCATYRLCRIDPTAPPTACAELIFNRFAISP